MIKVAVSIGDINGISAQILLEAHEKLSALCTPYYIAHKELIESASKILNISCSSLFNFISPSCTPPAISPGEIDKNSGRYSFESFKKALSLCERGEMDFILTLPIHKLAWARAGVPHIGHTEALNALYQAQSIMLLGCEELFVALYTHHIALKDVPGKITEDKYLSFLLKFERLSRALRKDDERIALIALNPHAGDGGLIGDEETIMETARMRAQEILKCEIFSPLLPPDSAFSSHMREQYRFYIAPYHDIGLSTLKALYFKESVNITLGLPVVRTSPDHGVGFDIAYKNRLVDSTSYLNAAKAGIRLRQARSQS